MEKNNSESNINMGPEENKKMISIEDSNRRMIIAVLLTFIVVVVAFQYLGDGRNKIQNLKGYFSKDAVKTSEAEKNEEDASFLAKKIIPDEGVELPATWKDFGKQLADRGVIDGKKFEDMYEKRGGLTEESKKLLYGTENGNIKITKENSGIILNLLWAFGLGNKNQILENGPMTDKQYGGAEKFASTGGWTIAKGKAMDHYSKYKFVTLTSEQQAMVERVSQGIYRPCCGNSTYFPDCNHGMAMLGLLEIMASQGVSEADMYSAALKVNSYWFPDTYLTLASYYKKQRGMDWDRVDPEEVLSVSYSSSSGYRNILQSVDPVSLQKGGGSCGV